MRKITRKVLETLRAEYLKKLGVPVEEFTPRINIRRYGRYGYGYRGNQGYYATVRQRRYPR